jgi:maleylacetate reductase
MQPFIYEPLPTRVIFGSGVRSQLSAELDRLRIKRPLVLATPQQVDLAREIARELCGRPAEIFAGAVMHTPVAVSQTALAFAREHDIDGLVAVGGGSTTGLGKAIAFRTDLPQIVLPTTYAGSEMTPILGETKDGRKTTQKNAAILPVTVLYDVDLTLSLPPGLSATSGLNAIAHAVEALYAEHGNPIVSLMAEDGIAALARAVPIIVDAPGDKSARTDALYGAWLCGVCLGSVGMALHHKLCHTIGGLFDLPHAETHAILLPHSVAYNAPAVAAAMDRIARALGATNAARGLYDLAGRLRITRSLKAIGMPANGVDRAAAQAMENPYWNPRPLEFEAIRSLIARAYEGEAPSAA